MTLSLTLSACLWMHAVLRVSSRRDRGLGQWTTGGKNQTLGLWGTGRRLGG